MDRISLLGIELFAYGGVTEAERQVGQRYSVDVEVTLDLARAAESDALADTVSYAEIYQLVARTARERQFTLIESLAGRLAQRVIQRFPVQTVTVRVAKLLPPIDGIVARAVVEITRRGEGEQNR